MKILVLTGSFHKNGTSAYLAEEFIRGASENGNDVSRIDVARKDLKGCLGCNYCRLNEAHCIQNDAMEEIKQAVLGTEMLVLVTPLYFFGFSSQLKMAIDRLYVVNPLLQSQNKKMMLFATCNDKDESAVAPLIAHYRALVNNFGWRDAGMLIAQGYNDRESIKDSEYGHKAYIMGTEI
ncbi:MAG: flavodoxin family protein [Lachnospiraceae bacterium]|nr:flavodoxin family protein [Lachnospiraceae bacterium]